MRKPRTTKQIEDELLQPSSLRDHVVRLYDMVESLTSTVGKGFEQAQKRQDDLDEKFQLFLEERRTSSRIQWLPIIGVIVAVLGLIGTFTATALGTFWFIMSMKFDGTMNPIRTDIASIKVIVDQDHPRVTEMYGLTQKSLQDRADMRIQQQSLIEQVTELKGKTDAIQSISGENFRAIETQLRGIENYENLTRTYNNRMLGLLWQRTYGQPLPEFQYNPSISDHGPQMPELRK